MITILRYCLFLASITGYISYFSLPPKPEYKINARCASADTALSAFHLNPAFSPALFCAFSSGILFAAGLLNILPLAAGFIFIGGFLLLALSLKSRSLPRHDFILYAVFFIVLTYFFFIIQGAHFTSYDNFSHWATVVKDLLIENRMPNFEDTVIRFQSYPLGSSLFIYYVCMIIGASEDCMLWGQLFMLTSFLFCLAAFITKNRLPLIFTAAMYGMWALTVNNTIYELRVDTLLPLAGTAAAAVIYYCRKQPRTALYCSAGLFTLLINIKNSGVFFYIICLLFLTAYAWEYIRKHKLCYFGTALLTPIFAMYLWKRHVAFSFPKGMETKHSMSLVNYGQVFAKKTSENVTDIALSILKRSTSISSVEVKLMLVLTVFFILMAAIFHKYHLSKKLLSMLGISWGILAAYTLSLYAMYLFSMPLAEASHLASYDRYILSVLIFIYGISVIFIMNMINSLADNTAAPFKSYYGLTPILLTAALVCQVRFHLPTLIQKPDFTSSERCALRERMKKDRIKPGDSCFIYCKSTDYDSRYIFYLARYELWTDDILVVREDEYEEKKQLISEYDHFLIWAP